jgi:ribulose-5-phosphate 4-epimerase/fuculose-1-phosphate aldolase
MYPPDKFESDVFFLGVKDMEPEILYNINSNLEKVYEINKLKLPEFNITSFSVRSEKKFYVSSGPEVKGIMKSADFVEIVDYDPVRNSALALGSLRPSSDLPLHWFVYRTFPHINGILIIDLALADKVIDKLGIESTLREIKVLRPDVVMEMLPLFRNRTCVNLNDKGMVFIESSLEKLMDEIKQFCNKLQNIEVPENTDTKGEDQ